MDWSSVLPEDSCRGAASVARTPISVAVSSYFLLILPVVQLEAGMLDKIFHKMVLRRTVRWSCRCTKTGKLSCGV